VTGVDRIHRRKIGHISQKHGYLYHMAPVPADGFEHCLKVREDARRLDAYIPFNELSCCWVLSHLAREEEARSRESRSAVTILRTFLPAPCRPSAPVYTPPNARTGRLAGAQFPSAAVYAPHISQSQSSTL
jgi:hypothetical protein